MPATYEPIETKTLTSNQTGVAFTAIPATYTDLILVINAGYVTTFGTDFNITFNSDTASNYSRTFVIGDGTSATSGRNANQTSYAPGGIYNDCQYVIQIFNYANTTTFKTAIARVAIASQYAAAVVGLWRKTPEAINRIDISTSVSSNIKSGSTFTLYGIKAA